MVSRAATICYKSFYKIVAQKVSLFITPMPTNVSLSILFSETYFNSLTVYVGRHQLLVKTWPQSISYFLFFKLLF